VKPRMSRRLLLAAALGLATVAALAGCRVEQGAALFVGETRITDSQVDAIVDSIPVELITPDLTRKATSFGGVRGQVVEALTVVELGRQVADDTDRQPNTQVGSATRQGWSEATGLPLDNAFVELMGSAESYRELLRADATPEAPTEADIETAAKNYVSATGQPLDDATVAQLALDLNTDQGRELIGQNRQINQYVADYGVTANPKYGKLAIVTFQNASGVALLTAPVPS